MRCLHVSIASQVDKDVAVAKEHFRLQGPYNAMSPLVLHKGYTKDFLDGKVLRVRQCWQVACWVGGAHKISHFTDFLAVGTLHLKIGCACVVENVSW